MELDKGQLTIKPAKEIQVDQIMKLYARARTFMAEHGNPAQWPSSYPPEDLIKYDIQEQHLFVCMAEAKIVAVFYYCMGEDPDYREIREGAWLNEDVYGVVHRITSDGTVPGAGSFCLEWAWNQCHNLKIDTHRDNRIMQNLLKKNGFQYCGLIRGRDGGERLAYQKVSEIQK